MQQSIALLQALEWEGIAMVEYRHDPATGESALMEVNGRFWGSLPLAYHAGAEFSFLCYQLIGNNEAVANTTYRSGIRCRYMVPESRRLVRILFGQQQLPTRLWCSGVCRSCLAIVSTSCAPEAAITYSSCAIRARLSAT